MLAISLTIACSRYIYNGVILRAHPVRGESHNQRNAIGEVATQRTLTHVCEQSYYRAYFAERPTLFVGDQTHDTHYRSVYLILKNM